MHEAGENIQAGCYVTKMPDGLLYKSIAHHSHYHGLLGIALNDALAGELVTVQTEGSVTHSFYELEPNKHVHIRAAGDACNLSSQALGEPNATEDLFARVGFAINYDTIRLDAPFAIIHLPKVPPLE